VCSILRQDNSINLMFDILIGISQQELTQDEGHMLRGSSVTSHVSCSLSFPSQRQRYLSLVKHRINQSGVGENSINPI